MKRKIIYALSILLVLLLASCTSSSTYTGTGSTSTRPDMPPGQMPPGGPNGANRPEGNPPMGRPEGPGGPGMAGGAMGDKRTETDPYILSVIEEGKDRFLQFTYEDSQTGIRLEYSLFIPDGYDAGKKYPLLMYIPDATATGKSAKEIVEQYFGADIWVTRDEQKKHESFVLVPAFSNTATNDDWYVSDEVEILVNLIENLAHRYSIDEDRLYTTGQSMGCMASLYLNAKYPDLFAASLFVSGQWDVDVLSPLADASFFYITAEGDAKATGGQKEVMDMLRLRSVEYSYGLWSAQKSEEEQNESAKSLISKGNKANMIRFEEGTVLENSNEKSEHMASFNYGYRISAVRDWLFEQSR